MLVLLHGGNPRHVVEGHDPESEIRIIRYQRNFPEESFERRGGHGVHGRDEIGGRESVLIGWRAACAGGDVDLGMEFGDLLADGMVGAVDDGAAEEEGVGGGEVGGWDRGDVEGEFLAAADDESTEGFGGVHDVEFGDAGDDLVVEGEEHIAFLERLRVGRGGRGAVDFADHEELVPGGIGLGDACDPGIGNAHDACLRHLDGVGFDVEDAEVGDRTCADLVDDGEEGWGCKAEMVFDVFVGVRRAFTQVGEPEGFDGAVWGDKYAVAALTRETGVDGYGVQVQRTVAWRGAVRRNGHSRDISDSRLCNDNAEILIEAKEDSRGALLDGCG